MGRVVVVLALLSGALLPTSAMAGSVSGSVTMVSQAGDYIGGGTDQLIDSPGSLSVSGGLSHVEVVANPGSMTFDFAAPTGGQLEPGVYANAQRYPFEPAGSPGLSVSGDGRGCNQDYGSFTIKDIQVDGSGNITRFWALYEQHCESPTAPALFGEVRIGEPASTAPETVEPAAIAWPKSTTGMTGTYVPVTVIASASGARITTVSLGGVDPGDFAIKSDGCAGSTLGAGARCNIQLAPHPVADGDRTASLKITDANGSTTTVPLDVPAVAPAPGTGSGSPSTGTGSPPVLPPTTTITPSNPRPGKPDVSVQLRAVREEMVSQQTGQIVAYRYFFSAQNIDCMNGANRLVFWLRHTRHIVPCRSGLVVIGKQVAPHHSYLVRIQAVRMRKHRIVKHGARYHWRAYMPGNEAQWTPISQTPPTYASDT